MLREKLQDGSQQGCADAGQAHAADATRLYIFEILKFVLPFWHVTVSQTTN